MADWVNSSDFREPKLRVGELTGL